MEWKEIAGTVGKIAGTVAPLLSGPAGLAVSVGAQIAAAIGTEATPEAVNEKLKHDPAAMLKLEEWSQQEREQIREYHIRLNDIELKRDEVELSREQARLHNIEHAREQHKDNNTPRLLTVALFFAVCALGAAIFFLTIPEESRDLSVYFTGQIVGFFGVCVTYWVGTSLSSKQKTDKLGSMIK